ncbi:MAG: SRPBCC domain-containing protein [Sphingobacteriales bacterium]|nr:MAG: SRPBCC domain-containing protein [Sphingobacteriales bacterium]
MEKQLIVSRIFDAPVADVWKLWTESELLKQWWGPEKFTCTLAKINFKVGETSLINMQAPKEFGGQTHYNIWQYTEIVPQKSIAFIMNLADENGNKQKPTAVGMPADFPEDIKAVVTFKVLGENKTEVIVTEYAVFGQTSHFAKLGLEQSLNKAVAVFQKL